MLDTAKDYAQLFAYTCVLIFIVSAILYWSKLKTGSPENKKEAFQKASHACFSFQIKALIFWTAMCVLSIAYALVFK